MEILLVGEGAREAAIAWKLKKGEHSVHGFGGVDIQSALHMAREQEVDCTIVGPDDLLAAGIVNLFRSEGLAILGPTKEAARIEWDKSYTIEAMKRMGVPHPHSEGFLTVEAVLNYCLHCQDKEVVIKANGLAAGKGVTICRTEDTAGVMKAARYCARAFPGQPIVVQKKVSGREVSVFGFTDGQHLSSLIAACDYKRVGEGDVGKMTGGMGSYAWPEFWTPELEIWVREYIMMPVLRYLAAQGTPFCGVLYAGLMISPEFLAGEPTPILAMTLEFNARFGDPEAQVILPLLKNDLLEVMEACRMQELNQIEVKWRRDVSTVGVVLASDGYPNDSVEGATIRGLERLDPAILTFRGGDKGRMMTLVAQAPTVEEARKEVYKNVRLLSLCGVRYRPDIAAPAPQGTEVGV